MDIEKVLKNYDYKEARAMCYNAVYRSGTDITALKMLLDFSMFYGEVGNVESLLKKLRELGVSTEDSSESFRAYCDICEAVSCLLKADSSESTLDICLGYANEGLVYSKRSLFLRVVIVKCLIRLGRLLEAKNVCYNLLLDAPDYVPAILQEGIINFMQGQFGVSLSIFQRANQLDPRNPDALQTKTYQQKAGKFVELLKKAAFEQKGNRYKEAIATFSSLIVLGLSDKGACSSKEFLVPFYNSRARCYAATNQMTGLFDDCIKSLNIKRTTEAEDLLDFYFTKKREPELEQNSKRNWQMSINEYLTAQNGNTKVEKQENDLSILEPICELSFADKVSK